LAFRGWKGNLRGWMEITQEASGQQLENIH